MAVRHTELYIIEPKADTTTLVTNPSVEDATTGYTAVGGSSSIARTAVYQRRGTYSLDITPTSGAISGVYFGTVALVSGTTYVFSADVLDVSGQTFNLYIQAADGTPTSSSTSWTGDGYWKRKSISWACTSSETYRLYLTRSSVASTTHFYTDGWQCESGTESTYFDGDSVGFNRFRPDYGWNGTPHASTSWRSGKTRSGGTLLRVRDYAGIEGVIGLGMPPVVNNSIPLSAGGAFVQNTVAQPREFTLLLNFLDTAGLSGLYADRAQLVDAIKSDNVPTDEPIVLRWELEDTSGVRQSETLDLVCKYSGGLEYNASDPAWAQLLERAAVTFTAFDPMFIADGTQGADLGFGTSVANAAYLLYRTPAGVWTSAGVVNGVINDIKQAPDGKIYVTGAFTSIGGTAANRIAYTADGGATWVAMGTGLNGLGNRLAIAPDGLPYVVGAFTTANSVTVNYFAKWTGSTFSAFGTGANNEVLDIAFDPQGVIYICGQFTSVNSVASTSYVAKLTGSTWSAVAGGLSDSARALAIKKNTIYVAVTTGVSQDVYKTTGASWTATSSGIGTPLALAFGPDGALYAGGRNASPTYYAKLRMFNGGTWTNVLNGDDTGMVWDINPGKKNIFFSGSFTTVNGITMPAIVCYANKTLYPFGITIPPGSDGRYRIFEVNDGTLWIAGDWTTTPITSPTVTVSNNGSSKAYPIFRFTGPGTLWEIKNYTNGKSVYFNDLTLQAGETAILDLRPGRVSFRSTWRGNILRFLPGSDFDFFLISGANNISCYMTGTTGATKSPMYYQGRYWSIDAGAR